MNFSKSMIDTYIETIRLNYANDISMVILYGSYVSGMTHPLSDIDIVFIAKNDRAYEMSKQFIYENIGYDFFGISESRLNDIFMKFHPLVSIIGDGQLIYSDNETTKVRFESMQNHINTLKNLSNPTHFAKEIETILTEMKAKAFDFRGSSHAKKRFLQGQILYQTAHFLSLINRSHFRFGTKQLVSETMAMALKPKSILYYLELLIKDTVTFDDFMGYVQLLQDFWLKIKSPTPETLQDDELIGFYEEGLSTWNKLNQAIERKDLMTAYLAATTLESELSNFRAKGIILDSLFDHYDSTIETLKLHSEITQKQMLGLLSSRNIELKELRTPEEVYCYLREPSNQ